MSAKHHVRSGNDLPAPPSFWHIIGPSFVLLGLALGSGELILWPYLSAQYGMGLIWGALLGITLQYVLNTEAMRYTLYWGESVFVGFRKMSVWITLWYILSTFIPWSIPGFSSASSDILNSIFPWIPKTGAAIALLLLTGVILSSGKSVYQTIERFQKTIIFIGLPFIFSLAFFMVEPQDWRDLGNGILGHGDGWWLFPPGVAIGSFVAAFAYSGAGGNLNLAQSYYIKEKGFGMGKYMGKISSLFSGTAQDMELAGATFPHTVANKRRWKEWWRLVTLEHAVVFWVLGFASICVLAVLAHSTVYGQEVESGIGFLYIQADAIGARTVTALGTTFLIVSAITLFSTQVGVLESASRIISENVALLFTTQKRKVNASVYFSVVLWAQIILGCSIYLIGFREPRVLLTLAALCNAGAMMLSFPLIFLLNKKRLAPEFRAGLLRKVLMAVAFFFFAFLLYQTLSEFKV